MKRLIYLLAVMMAACTSIDTESDPIDYMSSKFDAFHDTYVLRHTLTPNDTLNIISAIILRQRDSVMIVISFELPHAAHLRAVQFSADGKVLGIGLPGAQVAEQPSHVAEWANYIPKKSELDYLMEFASADRAILRFHGMEGSFDYKLFDHEKKALREMLSAYRAAKEDLTVLPIQKSNLQGK